MPDDVNPETVAAFSKPGLTAPGLVILAYKVGKGREKIDNCILTIQELRKAVRKLFQNLISGIKEYQNKKCRKKKKRENVQHSRERRHALLKKYESNHPVPETIQASFPLQTMVF